MVKDEQTDDLQGFPNVDRIEFTFVGHPLPAPIKIPPCTGYDADEEFYTTTFGPINVK